MAETEVAGSNLKPLLGTDEAIIDGKGRVLFSKKKRDRLGDNFAMCQDELGCLCAYPSEEWNKIIQRISSYDPTDPGRKQYARLVMGTADDELSFDDQNRVVVPHKLRTAANLTKDVLIIGCLDHVEIWSKQEFAEYEKYADQYGGKRREGIAKAAKEMKGL